MGGRWASSPRAPARPTGGFTSSAPGSRGWRCAQGAGGAGGHGRDPRRAAAGEQALAPGAGRGALRHADALRRPGRRGAQLAGAARDHRDASARRCRPCPGRSTSTRTPRASRRTSGPHKGERFLDWRRVRRPNLPSRSRASSRPTARRRAVDGLSLRVERGDNARAARPERRWQDDGGRDLRGVPGARHRHGAGARARSGARRPPAAPACRCHAPGRRRRLHRGSGASSCCGCSPPTPQHPLDPVELLAVVGLTGVAGTPVKRLSGGQQQRLSLALALIGRPELVFLDEPTAGHGPAVPARHLGADPTVCAPTASRVVLTTHFLDEAEQLADNVVVIDAGRVVAAGTPAELTRAGAEGQIRFRAAPGLRLDLARRRCRSGRRSREREAGHYLVTGDVTPQLLATLTAWCAAQGVLAEQLSRRAAQPGGRVPRPHRPASCGREAGDT